MKVFVCFVDDVVFCKCFNKDIIFIWGGGGGGYPDNEKADPVPKSVLDRSTWQDVWNSAIANTFYSVMSFLIYRQAVQEGP